MKPPMELRKRKVKRNGFVCPFHPLQVCTYFVLLHQALVSAFVMGPLFPQTEAVCCIQLIFAFASGGLQIAVAVLGILTTISDPTDPIVYAHRRALQLHTSFEVSQFPSLCTICGTSVQGSSKHCGYCNRCVSQFDHHCKWLNNCIGGVNYRLFCALIGVLSVSQSVFCAFAGAFLRETMRTGFEAHCRNYLGWDAMVMVEVVMCITLLFAVLTTFGVSNLVALHIWLRKIKHMTTYDYIISQRKASKYKERISDSERLDVSENSYQLPLVNLGGDKSGRIVPEINVGLLMGRTDSGTKAAVASPNTEFSAEGKKGGIEHRPEGGL